MDPVQIYAFADEASPCIDRQIAAMDRNGLRGLEIRNVDGENVADISAAKAREVRRKLDDSGLITWSVGSPLGKIGIRDAFAPHLDQFRRVLDTADMLGAKNIRLFSFYIPEGDDPEVYRDEVLERLDRFLDAARGSGIRLCHENEKGIYGDIPARCRVLHQALPALSGVFDPANFVQCGADTLQGYDLLAEYISYLHIKDALPNGRVVPAGCGAGHVPELVVKFRARGIRDFTIEPHLTVFSGLAKLERAGEATNIDPYQYPDPDTAFDTACRAFRAIL